MITGSKAEADDVHKAVISSSSTLAGEVRKQHASPSGQCWESEAEARKAEESLLGFKINEAEARKAEESLLGFKVKEAETHKARSNSSRTAIEEASVGSGEPSEPPLMRCAPKPGCDVSEALMPLATVEPESINGVAEKNRGWVEVTLAVDSGATETVMNEEHLDIVDTVEGRAFKRGVKYEVANGVRIDNLGEKKFTGVATEGAKRQIVAQICDVNKALLSVRKVVGAGNRVVFDEVSYIEDKDTKERIYIYMEDQGGMYVLKLWVKADEDQDF
jgi:hypothetical protein